MKNNYLIIGLISVLIVGIGIYFLIVENGSNDVVQTTMEQGSFDVKLKEDEIYSLGIAARQHIIKLFTNDHMFLSYNNFYQEIIN